MPIGGNNGSGANGAGRAAVPPPWVKQGPQPIPMPAAPWTLNRRSGSNQDGGGPGASAAPPQANNTPTLRKTSKITITPSENGQPREVTSKLQSREVKVPIMTEKSKTNVPTTRPKSEDTNEAKPPKEDPRARTQTKKEESNPRTQTRREEPSTKTQSRQENSNPKSQSAIDDEAKIQRARENIENAIPVKRSLIKQASIKGPPMGLPPAPPPPPPPPPMAPPPPPDFEKKPLTEKHAQVLKSLRSRPRRRPDWSDMMKEVETGKKLKHVVCDDRSSPIIKTSLIEKTKGQFVYESEKANVHNALLKQIQFGVPLKKTRTNDRSKPILDGLRKFRRQMTIEEQIQKSESRANLAAPPPEEEEEDEMDEMDDIDKVRDDLQSTKQLLALELRNKEAQDRENKRLLARILNLEVELEREKSKAGSETSAKTGGTDDNLIGSLKDEAAVARKTAEQLETKYQHAEEQLFASKSELEEVKKQNAALEKKLQQALKGIGANTPDRRFSEAVGPPGAPLPQEDSEPEIESESESDSDDDDETRAERAARRMQRELKMLENKIRNFKIKEQTAKNERKALKQSLRNQQDALKAERKKYKVLQREVDKMASLMKEDNSEDEEEETEPEEEPEPSESESDSESESESETESESEDEVSLTDEQKRTVLQNRAKRYEGILNALKKGNYLLKANVDRLKDDLNKQREMSITLQEDLSSVLSELG